MKKSKSIIKVLMILTLIAMITMLTGCGNKDKEEEKEEKKNSATYTEVLDKYFKSIEKKDPEMCIDAYADVYEEEYSHIDEAYMEYVLKTLEAEYGDNIKISYEVSKEEEIDKDGLKAIQNYIKSYFDKETKVTAGYKLELKISIKGDDDKKSTTDTFYVYEIDGKWGIMDKNPEDAEIYLDEEDDDKDSNSNSKNESKEKDEDKDKTSSSSTDSTNSDYKVALDYCFKGIEKSDMTTFLKAFPKFYQEVMLDACDEEDLKNIVGLSKGEAGENLKITYKITSEKQYSSSELEKIKEYVEHLYEENVTVSDGYELQIEETITDDNDTKSSTNTMYVYKIDGSWSLLNISPSDAESYVN